MEWFCLPILGNGVNEGILWQRRSAELGGQRVKMFARPSMAENAKGPPLLTQYLDAA
jgi:hypothetical protein